MNNETVVMALSDAGVNAEIEHGAFESLFLKITFKDRMVRIKSHDCIGFDFVDEKDLIHHVFCDLGLLK